MSEFQVELAFFAESPEEAEAQGEAWANAEPHNDFVRIVHTAEKRPGRWEVFVILAPKATEPLRLGL